MHLFILFIWDNNHQTRFNEYESIPKNYPKMMLKDINIKVESEEMYRPVAPNIRNYHGIAHLDHFQHKTKIQIKLPQKLIKM